MSADTAVTPPAEQREEAKAEPVVPHRRPTLTRLNYDTMREEELPVDLPTAQEALRFLFSSSAWHDDLDLIRRKVRRWRETIYDEGWEKQALALRKADPVKWTFHRIAKKLGVDRADVQTLIMREAKRQ